MWAGGARSCVLCIIVRICHVFYSLVLGPLEPSCLWTGKLIPTNLQVINDHLFPDDYGWLPLTFTLTQTDNWTWIQQANGPL